MPHDLPPVASADDSLEAFLSRHSRRSSSIYVAVLILVCAGLGLLPVIRVDVSVQAEGIIRPATEKHEVVAGASGYVERVEVRENDRVQKGSEILKLVATPVDSRREILDAQLREIDSMVRDLEILTRPEQPVSEDGGIRTARYRTERMLYLEELLEVELRREQGMRELTRVREMAALDLTPQSELEEREFALNRLNAEKASLSQGFLGGWQARLEQLRTERLQLLERRSLLAEESARFVIRAPIEGTIEQMANISGGSFVQAGQVLAVVSPTAELVAEVFVSPADFGLLDIGMPVRLLIDAFNYSDWGFINGAVVEIPDDYAVINNRPVFRTVVKLEATELALQSGTRRQLKKGMTLRARFVVAERSLWQLLRDDINDWLNPLQRPA